MKEDNINSIRDAKKNKVAVIDVDGSYLSRKHQQLQSEGVNVARLGIPAVPLLGWQSCNENNYHIVAQSMPKVMPGK